MARESKLLQELGPKKYNKMVEESNKNYDKYRAGKVDPKTGIRNKEISFTDPRKSKIDSPSLCSIECECGRCLNLTRHTVTVTCGMCKKYHAVKYDWSTKELFINGESLGKVE